MSAALVIRDADALLDAEAIRAIYRPHIEGSSVSFELETPRAEVIAERIRETQRYWVWLVAEQNGEIVGYAYGGQHRTRAAYDESVETSVYIHQGAVGRGVGRQLYTALFARLAELGYCQAYAGATLPNPASVAFHESMGFVVVGVFPKIGYKFGRFHDVIWLHRELREEQLPEGSLMARSRDQAARS